MKDHQAMRELLPWFVNGTLSERQQSLVSDHLSHCRRCVEDVDELVAMAARFKQHGQRDLAGQSREAALAFAESLSPQRSVVGRHAVAGTVGAVFLAVVVATWALFPGGVEFRALSRTTPVAGESVIQIVFSDDATAKDVREVLGKSGQRMLSGPTAQGVYRIALDPADAPDRLDELRDHRVIVFAEMETLP